MEKTEFAACYITLENVEGVVFYDASSDGVKAEIDAVCAANLDDVLPGVKIPDKRGPWVWEGTIVRLNEEEIECEGTWRRPGSLEWTSWGGF